jgi:hypothetical protein
MTEQPDLVPDDEFEIDDDTLTDAEADAIVGTADAEHPVELDEVPLPRLDGGDHVVDLDEVDLDGVTVEDDD